MIYLAEIGTRHYEFLGAGMTKGEAETALLRALVHHGRALKLEPTWALEVYEDRNVHELTPGVGYRDYTAITDRL